MSRQDKLETIWGGFAKLGNSHDALLMSHIKDGMLRIGSLEKENGDIAEIESLRKMVEDRKNKIASKYNLTSEEVDELVRMDSER